MPEFEPKTRNEALLASIANGQESTIVPQTRNEFLLSEISKKQVPEFTPVTRNEILLMEVARTVAEGGGGNPNSKQVIVGTVYEPFGDIDFETLFNAIKDGNATAIITFSIGPNTGSMYLEPVAEYGFLHGSVAFAESASYNKVVSAYWIPAYKDNPHSGQITMLNNGAFVDASELIKTNPSTLTVYWHPMPEGS